MNVAVAELGATITGFVIALYSTFASVLAPLILREPLRRQALIGLGLALIGTILLSEVSATATSALGVAAALTAAIGYALFLLLGRRWSRSRRLRPASIAFSASTTTAIVLMLFLAIADPPSLLPQGPHFIAITTTVWLGFVMGTGQFLVMLSAQRVEARVSASLLLLNPVTSAVLGVVLLGETLEPIQGLGSVMVLVGIGLASGLLTLIRRGVRTPRSRSA